MTQQPLPRGWVLCSLDDLGAWGSGGTPARSNPAFYRDGTIPWLVIGDLNDAVVSSSEAAITVDGLENSSAKLLEPGTLLIAMYGSIGKLGITGIQCATNQAIAFCRPKAGVNLRYLFRLLQEARPALVLKGKGGAQQNIGQGVLRQHLVRLAPSAEQQRIADKVDTVLARVDSCSNRLASVAQLLKRFRHSILAAATSGLLTKDWDGHGEAAWETVTVESLCRLISDGPFGSHLKSDDYVAEGARVVRLENIGHLSFDRSKETYISMEKYASLERHTLTTGDLLFSSFVDEEVRICSFADDLGSPAINKADCFCLRVNQEVCLPSFLMYRLACKTTYVSLKEQVHGATRPRINLGQLRRFKLLLPSRSEQIEIVRRIETLFAFADRLEARLDQAQTAVDRLTPSLLAKAFRGELIPQDPADEPAAELLKRLQSSTSPDRPARGRPRRSAAASA